MEHAVVWIQSTIIQYKYEIQFVQIFTAIVCETFPCCLQLDKGEKGYSLAWGQYTELFIYRPSYNRGLTSFGTWGCVVWWVVSEVSKEYNDFTVKGPDVPEKPLTHWHSFMSRKTESSRALLWEPQIFYCCKVHPVIVHEGMDVEHRYSYTPSLTSVLDTGGWSMPCPHHFTPGKETWYLSYRRFNRLQSQSGWVHKISPPLGLNLQTVSACSESLHRLS
jgi:hypothetical protein